MLFHCIFTVLYDLSHFLLLLLYVQFCILFLFLKGFSSFQNFLHCLFTLPSFFFNLFLTFCSLFFQVPSSFSIWHFISSSFFSCVSSNAGLRVCLVMKNSKPITCLFLYQETSWGTAYSKVMRTWVCRCVATIVCWEWCLFVLLIVLQAMWSNEYKPATVVMVFSGSFLVFLLYWLNSVVSLLVSTDTDLFQMFSWITLMFLRGHPPQNFIWAYLTFFDVSYFIHCVLYACVRRC